MSVELSSLFTNSDSHGIGKSNFVPTKTYGSVRPELTYR